MNLILLHDEDFTDEGRRVVLEGRRLQHVRSVHRAEVGHELRVGRLGGRLGHGIVTHLCDDKLEMEVALFHEPPTPLPVTLILALPRPKMLSRVVGTVASMGVKSVYIVNSWRVEKSYWDSPKLDEEYLWRHLLLGLEQGRDTTLPSIQTRRFLRPFIEEELPGLVGESMTLVAHPGAGRECPRAVAGPLTLAVGPEGGFIDEEIEMFERAGFCPVRCGERILRVEYAVPALLGRLF